MSRTLEEAFAQIDLSPPVIPDRWTTKLEEKMPWQFCAGNPPHVHLNDSEDFYAAIVSGDVENGLLIGMQCDHTNNWTLHYNLVEEDLILLLQMPCENARILRRDGKTRRLARIRRLFQSVWIHARGGVSESLSQSEQNIHKTLLTLAALLREMESKRQVGARLPGRLAVVLNSRSRSFWSWGPQPAAGELSDCQSCDGESMKSIDGWTWYFDDDPLAEALAALRKL